MVRGEVGALLKNAENFNKDSSFWCGELCRSRNELAFSSSCGTGVALERRLVEWKVLSRGTLDREECVLLALMETLRCLDGYELLPSADEL